MMLYHLIEANDLKGVMLRDYGLGENDITFIKELIGPPEKENETPHNVENDDDKKLEGEDKTQVCNLDSHKLC